MKAKPLVLLGGAILVFAGCAGHSGSTAGIGRYQTVVNDVGWVIMTDTKTGQAWVTGIEQPGRFTDKTFGQARDH